MKDPSSLNLSLFCKTSSVDCFNGFVNTFLSFYRYSGTWSVFDIVPRGREFSRERTTHRCIVTSSSPTRVLCHYNYLNAAVVIGLSERTVPPDKTKYSHLFFGTLISSTFHGGVVPLVTRLRVLSRFERILIKCFAVSKAPRRSQELVLGCAWSRRDRDFPRSGHLFSRVNEKRIDRFRHSELARWPINQDEFHAAKLHVRSSRPGLFRALSRLIRPNGGLPASCQIHIPATDGFSSLRDSTFESEIRP